MLKGRRGTVESMEVWESQKSPRSHEGSGVIKEGGQYQNTGGYLEKHPMRKNKLLLLLSFASPLSSPSFLFNSNTEQELVSQASYIQY